MQTIRPEFHERGWQLVQSHETSSDSQSDAESIGDLTLEMTDNPFADLMKKIEKLLDTGLQEDMVQAFELARTAIAEGIFERGQEIKLAAKLEEIIDVIHAERELGGAFTKNVLGTPAMTAEESGRAPAYPPPALDQRRTTAYTR